MQQVHQRWENQWALHNKGGSDISLQHNNGYDCGVFTIIVTILIKQQNNTKLKASCGWSVVAKKAKRKK
jgi:hypothetical protein